MGIFDKVKGLLGGNSEKINDGIDKAGDFIDSKTDKKFESQVDAVQEQVKNQLNKDAK